MIFKSGKQRKLSFADLKIVQGNWDNENLKTLYGK